MSDDAAPRDEELWRALDRAEPGPCPQPETRAAFADGGLDAKERAAFEDHVADCPSCLDELLALRGAGAPGPMPASVLAGARALGRRPSRVWSGLGWLATAAALMLGGFVGFRLGAAQVRAELEGRALLARQLSVGGPVLEERGGAR